MNTEHVLKDIRLLQIHIRRLGSKNSEGKYVVKYGVLFKDDICQNVFEAMLGTLKSAKKRKIVYFKGQVLLQGAHDDVDIVLLQGNDDDDGNESTNNNNNNSGGGKSATSK